MSDKEQTDNVRENLEKMYELIEPLCCSQVDKTFRDAIAALKSQSAAEGKLTAITKLCRAKQRVDYDTDYNEGYVNGWNNAANEILCILNEQSEKLEGNL